MKKNKKTQDDFEMYVNKSSESRSKQRPPINEIAKDEKSSKKLIVEEEKPIVEEEKPKKSKKFSIEDIEKEFEKKKQTSKKTEEPILEESKVIEKSKSIGELNHLSTPSSKVSNEILILEKLNYLEEAISSLVEVLPEIINKSSQDFETIQEKMLVLEEVLQRRSEGKKSKLFHINRDENGKLTSLELKED